MDERKGSYIARSCNDEESNLAANAKAAIYHNTALDINKDRRGTMVINKEAEELDMLPVVDSTAVLASIDPRIHDESGLISGKNLPVVGSAILDNGMIRTATAVTSIHPRIRIESGLISAMTEINHALDETITLCPHAEILTEDVDNNDVFEAGSGGESMNHVEVSTEGTTDRVWGVPLANAVTGCLQQNASSRCVELMNATFDVNDENSGEQVLMFPSSKNNDLDVSGIEPLDESPERQPLGPICGNTLKGNLMNPGNPVNAKTAALHMHGLPSMHDRSNFKAKPHLEKTDAAAEVGKKQDSKDHKSPYAASKSGKSKYASVSSRLYDENPRYARTTVANRMKSKSEKRRRSNTLNNPIRLRESRRRSRTNAATAPYNISSMGKHTASHVLGVRKTVEQLNLLKSGSKALRNFAPTSAR